MITSLKRFYFDDYKLKERTLLELVRAFGTGRLIAFIGSMATEAQGYGGWDQFIKDYVSEAARIGDDHPAAHARHESARVAIERIRQLNRQKELLEKRAAISIVREALSAMDEIAPLEGESRVDLIEKFAAERFFRPRRRATAVGGSTIRALVSDLAIRRFATLNYDLELEAATMVESGDVPGNRNPGAELKFLLEKGVIRRDRHRLARLLGNGHSIESDVSDRLRPDRLIEFAVSSAEVDYRIMHLHGRALPDEAKTMIVSLRDYDRLYRKDDIAKLPFEHGQRILFAGNPVLLVGVGMSEPEVNATLQNFVSNNPHRRFAPTFLLWNTTRFSDKRAERETQIWLKRIDFLQRLGVLTIFDEDLDPPKDVDPDHDCPLAAGSRHAFKALMVEYEKATGKLRDKLSSAREVHRAIEEAPAGSDTGVAKTRRRSLELEILAQSVTQIRYAAALRDFQLNAWDGPWRSLASRLSPEARKEPVKLWETPGLEYKLDVDMRQLLGDGRESHRVIIAPAGAGKGGLAWRLARNAALPPPFDVPVANRMIVNSGFAFDTDLLLLAVARFLLALRGIDWAKAPEQSREKLFERRETFAVEPGALIIINGMERFFTVEGAPLSAELDHLLRQVARGTTGTVRWIFLGTPRIGRYFRNLSRDALVQFSDCCSSRQRKIVDSVFFSDLVQRFERRPGSRVASPGATLIMRNFAQGDAHKIRRAVLGAYLNAAALKRSGVAQPGLALEILRAMAFIGSPVEAAVLLHVPRIRERLKGAGKGAVNRLLATLRALKSRRLVLAITPFEDYPGTGQRLWQRFGLHTAVSAELRHQFGVPVSEAKLSISFNMSLYVAQPVDGFIPEAAIHEELGKLIDHLIGAYKDSLHPEEGGIDAQADCGIVDGRQCAPAATAAIRAALSVIRSYYSTTTLLTVDRHDRHASEDRDGVLLEHAERMETLLRVYRKLRRARHLAAKSRVPVICGPEPFYPDDLVWIHNELGAVYLAQGDLYGARRSFAQAMKINRRAVEFRDHSHNWRRILMNQVLLDIERAMLNEAERKLDDLEESINARDCVSGSTAPRFQFVRAQFGDRAPADRSCFDAEIMHEEVLITALVLGHRGLCHHLRGHFRTAEPLYRDSIAILRRLGEHRAYAFFQRHFAQLMALIDPGEERGREMGMAVTAAESVRQMDMAYQARIAAAKFDWQRPGAGAADRHRALRQLTEAASYGALMDLYRLRIEAGIALARLKFESGDYETALDHATEAMALASRFGHSLRKISIRLDMGQILIRRGDPKSGGALLAHAAEAADRFGYQRAVETAQRIRVEEGVSS